MRRTVKGSGLYYSKVKFKKHIPFEPANGLYRNMLFLYPQLQRKWWENETKVASCDIDWGWETWYNKLLYWEIKLQAMTG